MKEPFEKQLEKAYHTFSKDHTHLREQLTSSICEPAAKCKQIESTPRTGALFGGRIMINRALKIAAGIIFVAISAMVIGYFAGTKTGTGVAFGQVLRQIQNSSYTFDLTTIAEGEVSGPVKGMVLPIGRLRFDAPQVKVSSIVDLNTRKCLILFHGQKAAMTDIPGSERAPAGGGPLALFTRPVENLWNLRDGTEKSLGKKEIDGQPAVGFKVEQEDPNYHCDIVVWAHAETGNPIRVEITISNPKDRSQSATLMMNKFNLDVKLDEKLFSLEPPAGYTLAHQKTLEETAKPTEATPEAKKIERSITLWTDGKEDESVQTLLSVDWTKPIEFSDKMYLFSLTEKGFVALKLQDQQKVMEDMSETMKQIRGPVKKLWELSQTARSNKDYQKAELFLETALNLGKLINRNPEGVVLSQSFGFSIRRKSLDEMKILYAETNQQEKLQQVEKQIQEVDAQRQSFLDSIKKQFGEQ